jgi:hypothetical protein
MWVSMNPAVTSRLSTFSAGASVVICPISTIAAGDANIERRWATSVDAALRKTRSSGMIYRDLAIEWFLRGRDRRLRAPDHERGL